ncbi:MAG: hypothetical protein HY912_24895 [Desulfomonile tiedjei]|uniref:BioF2-like acetyltransferase domain-containing protein n=1 Tax=Desulfomonile tiedjei TaxID=2358 RepID=A0A9D6Z6Q1_9BACT|nr:hypothetical protein [Desulfomonile tiedjei]
MVYRYAYIPEHLPEYVQAVSLAEPHIHEGYLCFLRGTVLIFIGYPLQPAPCEPTDQLRLALESACDHFQPHTVSVIAPRIPPEIDGTACGNDQYYRVELPLAAIKPSEAYMLRRAARELSVNEAVFAEEHSALIEAFVSERIPSSAHQEIFRSISRYADCSQTARLLEARKGSELAAFTIMDLGSADYGFYLFNFRSSTLHVPGASDLLFWEMAGLAFKEGKRHLNLGLGVSSGIQRFKEKWGATPFLPYGSVTIQRKPRGLVDIIRRMLMIVT